MPLLEHQKTGARKLLARGGMGGLWMDMGTGKTRCALAIAHMLKAKRILVVGPIQVPRIWHDELLEVRTWGWEHEFLSLIDSGSVKAKAKALRSMVGPNPCLVVVNYESYWRRPLREAVVDFKPDLLIYDEAHRLGHRGSKQSRFAHLLVKRIPHILGLTGTPGPNGYQDFFSVYKAIDRGVFGETWREFQWRYLQMGGFQGYQIVGYRNEGELEDKIQESSYRITKEETLDLPERRDVPVGVTLKKKTARIYEDLRVQSIAEIEGEIAGKKKKGTSVALTALVRVMRLQQVTSGFTKTTDEEEVTLSSEKADMLSSLLSDSLPQVDHVVVFCRFTHDVNAAYKVAEKYGPTYLLDGSVAPKKRDGVLDAWRAEDRATLVCQIAVGSLGIDLTAAPMAVFYSVDYSLTNYLQARDRLHRIGQTRKFTYYHLVATGTIDEKVYTALRRKENLQKNLLDMARIRAFLS